MFVPFAIVFLLIGSTSPVDLICSGESLISTTSSDVVDWWRVRLVLGDTSLLASRDFCAADEEGAETDGGSS
jgi:hypothetical protein